MNDHHRLLGPTVIRIVQYVCMTGQESVAAAGYIRRLVALPGRRVEEDAP